MLDVTLDQLVQYNLTFLPNSWHRIALGILNATTPVKDKMTTSTTNPAINYLNPFFEAPRDCRTGTECGRDSLDALA